MAMSAVYENLPMNQVISTAQSQQQRMANEARLRKETNPPQLETATLEEHSPQHANNMRRL